MSTMNIPESLIERAKAVTGQTRRDAAIRAVIELAEAAAVTKAIDSTPELQALVSESERELGAGKGKRFASAKAAMKWLKA